jgi:hypothetical protein
VREKKNVLFRQGYYGREWRASGRGARQATTLRTSCFKLIYI